MRTYRALDDLVAGVDIADRLGVRPPAVSNWQVRYADFPAPVVRIGRGNLPIFSWEQVERWAKKTGKLKDYD